MRFYSELFNEDLSEPLKIFEESVKSDLKVEAHTLESVNHALERFGPLYRPSDRGVQIKGRVRVVVIEGLDANACGGTHVASLSELGFVREARVSQTEEKLWELQFGLFDPEKSV